MGIGLFSQWSCNGVLSYYISIVLDTVGVKDPQTKALVNGGLQIWNFILAVSAALLVDRIGRRPLFLTSNLGMLVCFGMLTLTTALYTTNDDKSAANASIAIIACFFAFYDIAYTPMLVAYTVEILPYAIRAKGFAVMNLVVSAALAFNQFINPVAIDAIGWKYYLVYLGWLGFEFAYIWAFLVETKGRTLEETAAIFDGESYTQNLQNIGNEAATHSRHIYNPDVKEDLEIEMASTRHLID